MVVSMLEGVLERVRGCVTKPFDDVFQPYTGHIVVTEVNTLRLV